VAASKHEKRLASAKRAQQKEPLTRFKALLSRKTLKHARKPTEDHILSILLVRRAAVATVGKDLFSDPAWYMLLELYAAHLGGRTMTLSELARATDTPESTAKRWLQALRTRGLVVAEASTRYTDETDVRLTPGALTQIEHLATHWVTAFTSI
jgi:DNA-binding MarR family transcriptional regulator